MSMTIKSMIAKTNLETKWTTAEVKWITGARDIAVGLRCWTSTIGGYIGNIATEALVPKLQTSCGVSVQCTPVKTSFNRGVISPNVLPGEHAVSSFPDKG